MPFTPYHFGPSGFIGLLFKRWLDLPVFLLTNIAVDFEVLFQITHLTATPMTHWNFPHQVFHFHTLLIGGFVGAVLGLALFPFREIFEWFMEKLRLPYKPTAFKMVFSGLLGAWFHVLIDGAYHWDVQMFWPNKHLRPLWNLLHRPEIITQTQIKYICLAFAAAAVCLYIFLLAKTLKSKKSQR